MKQKRTAEDYLKTIHILSRHGEVRGTHIADVLGVSRATVSHAQGARAGGIPAADG